MLPELAVRASVGKGGKNDHADVRVVQLLLNTWLKRAGQPLLAIDGIAGPLTCGAIASCQKALGLPVVDGRVDPKGPTLKTLAALSLEDLVKGLKHSGRPSYVIEAEAEKPRLAGNSTQLLWTILAGTRHLPG